MGRRMRRSTEPCAASPAHMPLTHAPHTCPFSPPLWAFHGGAAAKDGCCTTAALWFASPPLPPCGTYRSVDGLLDCLEVGAPFHHDDGLQRRW